jgi:hypothetical protein
VPGGGYFFGRSHFRASADGRALLDFVVATECAPSLTLPRIQVGSGGAFGYTGTVDGRSVVLDGRFSSPQRAEGTVRVRAAGCDSGAIRFSARLS